MSEKLRLDRKIGFRNTFYTKCINVLIDSIGPSIILRSIYIYIMYIYINSAVAVTIYHRSGSQMCELDKSLRMPQSLI